jgi:hypothetical protein
MDYKRIPLRLQSFLDPKVVGTAAALTAWGFATFREHEGEYPIFPPDAPLNDGSFVVVSGSTTTTTPPPMPSNWQFPGANPWASQYNLPDAG